MIRRDFSSAAPFFSASFLLFLVEPIAAKQLLPALGGSAAVWITCLVFFQTALLVAYLYAHWLAHRSHWMLHFALLLLAAASAIAWSIQHHQPGLGSIPSPPSSARSASPSAFPSSCSAQPARCCRCGWRALEIARHSLSPLRALEPRIAAGARALSHARSSRTSR